MGFVPKSENAETIVAALRAALAGGVFLPAPMFAPDTPMEPRREPDGDDAAGAPAYPTKADGLGITRRQMDVLRCLVQGLPNKRIATKLEISVPVVKKHVSDLLAHFNVISRTHLVAMMAQRGVRFGPPELSNPRDEIEEDKE